MKRKFLSFILAFVLILPVFMFLTACDKDKTFDAKLELKTTDALGNAVRFQQDIPAGEKLQKELTYNSIKKGDELTFYVYIDKGYDHAKVKVTANGTAINGSVKEVGGDGQNDQNVLRDREITYKVKINEKTNIVVDATNCSLVSYKISLVNSAELARNNAKYVIYDDFSFVSFIPNTAQPINENTPINVPYGKDLYILSKTKFEAVEYSVSSEFNSDLYSAHSSTWLGDDYKYQDYYVYYIDLSYLDELNLFVRGVTATENNSFIDNYRNAYNIINIIPGGGGNNGIGGIYADQSYQDRDNLTLGQYEGKIKYNNGTGEVEEYYRGGTYSGEKNGRGYIGLVYIGDNINADLENDLTHNDVTGKLYYRIGFSEILGAGLSIDDFTASIVSMDDPSKKVDLEIISAETSTLIQGQYSSPEQYYFVIVDKDKVESLVVSEADERGNYKTGTGLLCINLKEEKKNEFIKLNFTSNLYSDSLYYIGDYEYIFDDKVGISCINIEDGKLDTYISKTSFEAQDKPLKLTLTINNKDAFKANLSHAILNIKGKDGTILDGGKAIRIEAHDFGDDRQGVVIELKYGEYGFSEPLQDEYTIDVNFVYETRDKQYNNVKLDLSELEIPENLELFYTTDYASPFSNWKKLDKNSEITISDNVPIYLTIRAVDPTQEFYYQGIGIYVKVNEEDIEVSKYDGLNDIRGNSIDIVECNNDNVKYLRVLPNNITGTDGKLYLKFKV